MKRKEYQKPSAQTFAVESVIMQDAVSVNTDVWGNQTEAESRRHLNKLWDEDEDDYIDLDEFIDDEDEALDEPNSDEKPENNEGKEIKS